MMALKLLSLGRGASGVRWEPVALLQAMLERGVTPVVPLQGSVGASGDLAPLAHMAAVMLGEGRGRARRPGAARRRGAGGGGAPAVTLAAKEGLALINGTQFSTAWALAGLFAAWRAAQNALLVSAMSTDAIMGRPRRSAPRSTRSAATAARSRPPPSCARIMAGSEIRESHRPRTPACRTPTASAASRR